MSDLIYLYFLDSPIDDWSEWHGLCDRKECQNHPAPDGIADFYKAALDLAKRKGIGPEKYHGFGVEGGPYYTKLPI